MLRFITSDIGDVALTPCWPNPGPPTNGVNGTHAGFAQPGDLLADTQNKTLYQQVGTVLSPVWSLIGSTATADITSGTISGVTINNATIGGTTPAAGSFTTLSASTSFQANGATIIGGSINNATIGGTTPAAGSFTTLSASTSFQANGATIIGGSINGATIGGTTPAAGTFTTLAASGAITGSDSATVNSLHVDTGTKTASASAGEATLNKNAGVITSEALSTAAGSDYALTVTNSAVAAADQVFASVQLGTSATGEPVVTSVTTGSGSVVINVRNLAATDAFAGTIKVSFLVVKN